ncbi:MAG TPA: glutaredoxin [Sphingomicrobium sp.]
MADIILYRMVLPTHTCPYGIRAKEALERAGVEFQDHVLRTREEVESFKLEHDVATTPQLFVDGERIGGSRQVEAWLAENGAEA